MVSLVLVMRMPLVAWCVDRSLRLDHTFGSKSCLVQVMHFTKIVHHDVDSPNAPRGAPHYENYGFKWAKSMITRMWPFFVHQKNKSIGYEDVVCEEELSNVLSLSVQQRIRKCKSLLFT